MPSKTYNSPTHHLRRLSWPTLINPNVLICKSRTTEFKDDDDQPMTNGREVRLIKLNGRQSNNTFRAANSTLVDNLFRSIRKRKLKHPINCFNRKNVKLQLLFSCPTTSAQDYLHIVNLNRSMRSRTPTLSQSAINLTELDNGLAFKRLPNQRRLRCATRSSVDEFELLNMEWLKALRNSMETSSNRKLADDEHASTRSFNNLIKIESFENAGVRLFGYVADSSGRDLITKDCKDCKEFKEFKFDRTADHKADANNFKPSLDFKSPTDFKSPEFRTEKDRLLFDNRIDELFNKNDLKENDAFAGNQLDPNEIALENLLIDEALSFPVGRWERADCEICFQECWLHRRVCCDYAVCSSCLSQYFQERVSLGSFSIECISNRCHSPVNRNEISISLEPKFKEIYHNLLRVNNDLGKLTRTCPNCNYLHKLKDNSELKKMRKHRKKDPTVSRVKCEECEISWCFLCHAPWHANITCKQFIAGDRLLRDWAKQFNGGQVNAQKCPTCKAFIQRISGCDHMHCSNCETNFCYKCGEKLRHLKFFGNHYSKLSVFGCKYRYKANQPALRKTIRFTVFCAKLATAPVLGSAILAGIGIAISVGIAALPVYLALKGTRWVVEQRSHKPKNQSKTSPLRTISKKDIDSALQSSKLDELNGQQYIHFGGESPLHTATFTQNANWLANYGLMQDLSAAAGSATSDPIPISSLSNFGFGNFADFDRSASIHKDLPAPQQTKRRRHNKHRKPQLFQPIY